MRACVFSLRCVCPHVVLISASSHCGSMRTSESILFLEFTKKFVADSRLLRRTIWFGAPIKRDSIDLIVSIRLRAHNMCRYSYCKQRVERMWTLQIRFEWKTHPRTSSYWFEQYHMASVGIHATDIEYSYFTLSHEKFSFISHFAKTSFARIWNSSWLCQHFLYSAAKFTRFIDR